jgi:hypothetical protein
LATPIGDLIIDLTQLPPALSHKQEMLRDYSVLLNTINRGL